MKNNISDFFRKYKFNSILFKYFIRVFAIMVIIFFIIICTAYNIILNMFFNDMYADNNNELKSIGVLSETTFRDVEYIASNTLVNNYVDIFFKFSSNKIYVGEDIEQKIASLIVSYKSISRYIYSMYVYSEVSNEICSESGKYKIDEFYDNDWLEAYKNEKGEVWCMPTSLS